MKPLALERLTGANAAGDGAFGTYATARVVSVGVFRGLRTWRLSRE